MLKFHYSFLTLLFSMLIMAGLNSCQNNQKTNDYADAALSSPIVVINYELKGVFSHDKTLFTEGFLIHNGQIFESTGSPEGLEESRSMIGKLDTAQGRLDVKIELDKTKYFGEGIAILNGRLYQLTYKNQLGFIYDVATFKKLGEFKYTNFEGWGLTTDGKDLIMSDGTSQLTFLNPDNMKPARTLNVTENKSSVPQLNELEFIDGFIYANVWLTNNILKIDPSNGKVVGKLDLAPLYYTEKGKNSNVMEMNGIAYDAKSDRVFVTGKLWANVYEIDFDK